MSAVISLLGAIRYNALNRELLKAKELATSSRLFSNCSAAEDHVPLAEKLTRRRLIMRLSDVNQTSRRRLTTRKSTTESPFNREELIQRIGGQRIRCARQLHSSYNLRDSAELKEADCRNEEWHPVYRFRGIPFYATVSRLKIVQTIGSVLLMPYCYYKFINEEIGQTTLMLMGGAAIFAPIFLILFTRYFNRIVGVISLNQAGTIARVGHLSFWGGRQDTYITIDNIVPLSESPDNPRSYYINLRQYTGNAKPMIIGTRKVEICDIEGAKAIFGSIDCFVAHGAYVSDEYATEKCLETTTCENEIVSSWVSNSESTFSSLKNSTVSCDQFDKKQQQTQK